MGREFELKYRLDAETLTAIRDSFGEFTPISMETTYYDTPDRAFHRLHWTVRRRFENGVSVCTVKTPAPGGGRGEWEVRCDDICAAIALLTNQGAPETLARMAEGGLEAVCSARFTRLAKTLELSGNLVELALDEGVLLGGKKTLPFLELEVEHKSGSEALTAAWAAALAERYNLEPEPRSKVQRARALAER